MIEKFIKNEQTLKHWKEFKSKKLAFGSLWLVFTLCFFSFTAEFWANSKPILLKHNGNIYFPFIVDYPVKEFDIQDTMIVDYRKLKLNHGDWIVWPVIKWDPYESNTKVAEYPAPPSSDNLFGTDDRGRDVLVRLLYGLRYSMTFAVLVWFITFFVGTVIGGIQGFRGGWFDLACQRVIEVFQSIPQFYLLIILIFIFKPTLLLLVFIMSLFGWIDISYYVRAEYLKNRRLDYVESARALGASGSRIFFKHILPNSLTPIITFSPFVIAGLISGLASLDYLGFGLTPPTPSWGELLAQAHKNFTVAWWLALYPSMALFTILVLLNLVGEGVRDVLDPRKA